ncbi:HNH endonuclease [Clostridium butyricum]|uniref:HNH endonuclease n=1 Tax=Clostridium butyricum TaxID=1492 RepID=UPI003D329F04
MSNTYLLKFNSKDNRYYDENFEKDMIILKTKGVISDRHSCGRTKSIKKGDRIFIMRTGESETGIFISAYATSDVFEDLHWKENEKKLGKKTNYIDINIEYLGNFNKNNEMLTKDELIKISSNYDWSNKNPAIKISKDIADQLESVWEEKILRKNEENFINIDETTTGEEYYEGAVTTIKVNKYERNSKARQECINEYGYTCYVCGTNLQDIYGKLGERKIHVHHIKEIHTIGKEYKLNPKEDLRPVCPNCHSIIHSKRPPYTIEEVKKSIKK